jgi:STE24 endopeptidase
VNALTWSFLAALLGGLALCEWLARRQIAHVRAHRERVPEAFRATVAPETHRTAADYTCARLAATRWEAPAEAVLVLALTLGGGLEGIAALWGSAGLTGLAAGTAVVLTVLVVAALVDLPFAAYRTFGVEARFGFNRTSPALFAADRAKELALTLVLAAPLVAAVLWLMGVAGERWWLWAWLLWLGFTLALGWAFPVLLAPLFNRFTPLSPGELRGRIEALLARTAFPVGGIFVMDGSRRSRHGNAYFTGFGSSRRVVLFDTLVEELDPAEAEAVLAHEIGHFKLRHLRKRLAVAAVVGLAGFALLGWLSAEPWFYAGLGVATPSPHAALVLFALAAPAFTFYLQPLANALSRRHELAADAFAARETSGQALIRALVKLYSDNGTTLTPDPLFSRFHDSHPAAAQRIARLEPARA